MKIIAIPTLLLLLVSCNQNSCHNLNPVFDKYKSDDYQYTYELGKQLLKKGIDNFDYTVAGCNEEELKLTIQDDSICAVATLRIIRKDETIVKLKQGKGYVGAKIKGLDVRVLRDLKGTYFVYAGSKSLED